MNRATFFAGVRSAPFGAALSQPQVDGMNAILDGWDKRGLTDLRWLAYMLATTFHETDRTMQPIREYGGAKARYAPYYGRGYVQLTWEANYRRASTVVGIDLVKSPDRALELPIATAVLFSGMIEGWFTGHKLVDYMNSGFCDYQQARRIVNGTDRAVTIAGYAVQFERALRAAADQVVDINKVIQPQTHDQPVLIPAEPRLAPRGLPAATAPASPAAAPSPGGFWPALARLFAAFLEAVFPKKV